MRYRKLGRSGLTVSELCLGAMMFGGIASEEVANRIIDSARDRGVNFIDTADTYVRGRSEEVVGRALAKDRDRWVLATKVGNPVTDNPAPNERGLSRKWILHQAEASLRRLQTDYIDLYYLHREDPDTSLEETLAALADLQRQGKIRYYGVSNHQSWKLAALSHLADARDLDRPAASQINYSIVNRTPEKEHFHLTGHYGPGVVVYSPLARGVLTGKYVPGEPPPADSRAGRGGGHDKRRMQQTEWRAESLAIAQRLRAHAEALGITASEFAVAWALNNSAVASVIAGPRTEDQWQAYLRALDYAVTAEDETLVDSLVTPGHASTLGYNHPNDLAPFRRAPGGRAN